MKQSVLLLSRMLTKEKGAGVGRVNGQGSFVAKQGKGEEGGGRGVDISSRLPE